MAACSLWPPKVMLRNLLFTPGCKIFASLVLARDLLEAILT